MFGKKFKATALAAAIISQLVVMPASADTGTCNVANPKSVGTMSSWTGYKYTSCEGYITLDDDTKYSGTSSLKIVNPSSYGSNIYMQARSSTNKLEAGKTYRIGAMIKAEDASNISMGILEPKISTSILPVSGTYDWQRFEISFTATEDKAIEINFQCEDATRALWIDDVFCYEYKDGSYVGSNLVKNSNFDGTAPAPSEDDGSDDTNNMTASERINELSVKYNRIKESETFEVDEIKEVMGNFKYIPLYKKDNIAIDGELADWDGITSLSLPTNSTQYHIYNKNVTPDATGDLKLAYDDEYLYIAMVVTDDVHTAQNDDNCWQKDSLQMAIGSATDSYGVEINMARDPETGKGGVFSSALDRFDLDAIKMVPKLEGTRLTYEIAVPWKIRYSGVPEFVMFDILINDNDNAGRAYTVELAPGIAEGKTNAEFPKVEPVDPESGWYTWVEGPTKIDSLEQGEYHIYIVNEGEDKDFAITKTDGTTEFVTIKKGQGVHKKYSHSFPKFGDEEYSVTVKSDEKVKTASMKVQVLPTESDYEPMLAELDGYVAELGNLLEQCEAAGIVSEYEKLRYNIIEYCSEHMRKDIEKSHFIWLDYNMTELRKIFNEAKANLNAYLAGEKTPHIVPTYAGGKATPVGNVYHTDTEVNGTTENRPFFFIGYGHWFLNTEQQRKLGGNVSQYGDHYPHYLLFGEDGKHFFNQGANGFEGNMLPFAENAAEDNVRIEYLLGAEKFMTSLAKNYPETVAYNNGGGSFNSKLHNYNSEKFREYTKLILEDMLPRITKWGSIGSITLSNEPMFDTLDRSEALQPYWAIHLAEVYNGDIDYLNRTYGTSYEEFIDVEKPAEPEATPRYYDYNTFLCEYVADYFGYMTDVIQEIDPTLETQVKIRPMSADQDSVKRTFLDTGVNMEMFAEVLTANGCDASAYYNKSSWQALEKSQQYDLLTGFKEYPVYNTEDHIIGDSNSYMGYEQADHVEGDLWQGAVHGRGVSIIWYFSPNSYTPTDHGYGMWPWRPDCMEAVGTVQMDLNRLAYEVEALANKKARVAELYSQTSRIYDYAHMATGFTAYETLLKNGEKVKYVGERTIERDVYDYDVLIVPYTTHTPASTVDTVYKYIQSGKKVVLLGRDCLKYDEHNYENDAEKLSYIYANSKVVDFATDEFKLTDDEKKLVKNAVTETVKELGQSIVLVDAQTNQPVEDVEFLSVDYDGRTIVNMVSHNDWGVNKKVKIMHNGVETAKSYDLRTDTSYGNVIELEPSIPQLIELNIGEGAKVLPFDDIADHWGCDNIVKLYEKNMISGMGDRIFAPEGKVTVAEFISMAERACGIEPKAYTGGFSDVAESDWFATAVQAAADAGMLDAITAEGKLTPNREITREEMCYVIMRAYEHINGELPDAAVAGFGDISEIDERFSAYVNKAYEKNIISGMGDNTFAPKKNASRAEAVTIMLNLVNVAY